MVASRARVQILQSPDQPKEPYVARINEAGNVGNGDYGSKRWCENQIVVIIKSAMRGRPAKSEAEPAIPRNHTLALQALMSLAKLKGYIIEKRSSLSAKLDLSKLSPAELNAQLNGALDQLAPGERQKLLASIEAEGLVIDAESEDL